MNAAIFSVNSELQVASWETSLSFFPRRLCLLIECAMQQCQYSPDESWPDSVLNIIGRNDLCSKYIHLLLLKGDGLICDHNSA